jgi:hypothetical protein
MMQRVTPGQKLSIKAADYNAMLEAAQAEKKRQASFEGAAHLAGLDPGSLLAINQTGKNLGRGEPAALEGFLAEPETPDDLHLCSLVAAAPMDGDRRPLAVAIDGIPSGAMGRFRVMGQALVDLAAPPAAGQGHAAFDEEGRLHPAEHGQARILAAAGTLALILLGAGDFGEPPPKGMFQILDRTPEGGAATVRICNGNDPESEMAGIAVINSQAYSCPAAEFTITASVQYFFLKFTPPKTTAAAEQTESLCELVSVADTETVVSTDSVLYSLIGHAWTETVLERTIVKISQDHIPGLLAATWYGPCLGLLEGIVE